MVCCCGALPSVQSSSNPHSSETLAHREPMVQGWRVELGEGLQVDASRVDVRSAGAAGKKNKMK